MNVIRDSLYAHGDMIELAQEVGLSASTLFAIRSGRTKWPRHNTIFSLINALGLEMVLQKRRP
jgi:DNA-binding phage protein